MTQHWDEHFDAVVVGGGPAGATAATELASDGWSVLLLDKAGRIKPCGGAVPPRLIRDYAIPDELIVARATSARMISPSEQEVIMPIDGGYVGMVDRGEFDEWLRNRAASEGAERRAGTFMSLERSPSGHPVVVYKPGDKGRPRRVRAGSRCRTKPPASSATRLKSGMRTRNLPSSTSAMPFCPNWKSGCP